MTTETSRLILLNVRQALAYYRVSTEEQAVEGKSLETQKKLCHKWAQDNTCSIVSEFSDDGKSGTSLNRPALKELITRCQEDQSISVILVQDTDRLARNTLDHLTIKSLLKKVGVEVISISQPMIDDSPEGSLIDTILASVNAFQSQITGRKTSKVLEQKAKMGWWPGGRPPLGYRNIENPKPTSTLDKKIVAIDTETAPYMKEAFELYSSGQYSAQIISNKLNDQGLRSVTGTKIHDSVLITYFQNPFYIGKMRWRKEILSGKHPPLITKEVFDLCQQVLSAHNQNGSRTRKHNYLLRGFVFCYDCGHRLWAEKHIKKSGTIYEFYYCISCRKNTYVDKEELEGQIERKFETIKFSEEYALELVETARQLIKESRNGQNEEKSIFTNRKAKLEAAMRETEDDRFVRHTISDDAFKRIYSRYETELNQLENQLGKMSDNFDQKVEILKKVFNYAIDVGTSYKEAEDTLKRFYLDLFWEGFDIYQGKIRKSRLNEDLKPLILANSVRVRQSGLRG